MPGLSRRSGRASVAEGVVRGARRGGMARLGVARRRRMDGRAGDTDTGRAATAVEAAGRVAAPATVAVPTAAVSCWPDSAAWAEGLRRRGTGASAPPRCQPSAGSPTPRARSAAGSGSAPTAGCHGGTRPAPRASCARTRCAGSGVTTVKLTSALRYRRRLTHSIARRARRAPAPPSPTPRPSAMRSRSPHLAGGAGSLPGVSVDTLTHVVCAPVGRGCGPVGRGAMLMSAVAKKDCVSRRGSSHVPLRCVSRARGDARWSAASTSGSPPACAIPSG
jgi:hypothetical protein